MSFTASAATTMTRGWKVEIGEVFADAFGNALGNAPAGTTSPTQDVIEQAQEAQASTDAPSAIPDDDSVPPEVTFGRRPSVSTLTAAASRRDAEAAQAKQANKDSEAAIGFRQRLVSRTAEDTSDGPAMGSEGAPMCMNTSTPTEKTGVLAVGDRLLGSEIDLLNQADRTPASLRKSTI